MALGKKLERYLIKNNIDYDELLHKTVYTAYDLAQTTKKKLSDIAKTIAFKVDNKYILVVLPASHRVDLMKLKKMLKAKKLTIVKEVQLSKVFKIKPGTIVPFASFHNVPIYVDKALLSSRVILINSGSFTSSLQVKTKSLVEQGASTLTTFSKKHLKDPIVKKKVAATVKKVKKTLLKKNKNIISHIKVSKKRVRAKQSQKRKTVNKRPKAKRVSRKKRT